MGRPATEMTPENIEDIIRTVRLGLHPDRAAQAHGIAPATMRSHKKRHPEFATRLKEAESSGERGFLGTLIGHCDKQWTACAWMLERRWPERWAKREPEAKPVTRAEVEAAMIAAAKMVSESGGA